LTACGPTDVIPGPATPPTIEQAARASELSALKDASMLECDEMLDTPARVRQLKRIVELDSQSCKRMKAIAAEAGYPSVLVELNG
jgi:hypothetical protein